MGFPTEPMRLCTSSFGITMNVGPASLMPNEFETDACGSRSTSVSNVLGATGALPTDTCWRLDRSASAKCSWATISSAERGHEHAVRRPERLDVLEPAAGVELRLVEADETHLHRVVDERDAREREHRRAVQPAVAGERRLVVGDHGEVAVPDRDALGQPGRPRRVHDVGEVVLLERHLHGGVVGREHRVPVADEVLQRRQQRLGFLGRGQAACRR